MIRTRNSGSVRVKGMVSASFQIFSTGISGGISPVDSEQSKIWGSLKISRRNPCSPFFSVSYSINRRKILQYLFSIIVLIQYNNNNNNNNNNNSNNNQICIAP